ncbi:hypothetical protein B0H14DRAFT_3525991 [Mycena olivaceomarginata]|nr:hypothetical protein B0H14DRAFT_3525991 [Mycena olivaceomarginata]
MSTSPTYSPSLPSTVPPLLYLDLYSISAMPLPRILALWPALTTVAFNADWRLVRTDDEDVEPPLAYERLTNVGLHGVVYARGVSFSVAHTQGDPFPMFLVTSANDRTLSALCACKHFPALRRVLSHSLLEEFDRTDGPTEEGMARWEWWWEACNRAGG